MGTKLSHTHRCAAQAMPPPHDRAEHHLEFLTARRLSGIPCHCEAASPACQPQWCRYRPEQMPRSGVSVGPLAELAADSTHDDRLVGEPESTAYLNLAGGGRWLADDTTAHAPRDRLLRLTKDLLDLYRETLSIRPLDAVATHPPDDAPAWRGRPHRRVTPSGGPAHRSARPPCCEQRSPPRRA
jgi:hypothetical protein